MEYKDNQEVLYILEVHGYAPEFWPAAVCRRSGTRQLPKEQERQKEIKCPYCGKLLMIVSASRRLDLIRFKKKHKAPCHEYRKCRKCHENVGIIYTTSETA